MTEEVRALIRRELLEILEEANERSRQGSQGAGFCTSVKDMSAGKGTPTEYLVQVIRERLEPTSPRAAKGKQAAERKAPQKGIGRWEDEGGATTPRKKGGLR